MRTTLAALAVITVGYILAYLLFDRLRDRFGYVGGGEYVLIGFLLGPRVTGLLNADAVRDLSPIVSLAFGWMGMLLGTSFRLPTMVLADASHLAVAFGEAAATFSIALAALLGIFHWLLGYPWEPAAIQAVTLAAIATLSAPGAIDAFAARGSAGPLVRLLQLTARIDALIAVAAFGLILAIFHRGEVSPAVRPPTATEWAVINLGIGVGCGVLFHLFLGPRDQGGAEDDASRLFVAVAGAIVIASGASYYLNFSPIYTTLIVGFILVNTGSAHRETTRLLASTEHPVYLALLIFAGAAWSPGDRYVLFVAPLFVAIRMLARFLGGRVAASRAPAAGAPPGLGRGLLAQGGLAVALALNYTQVYAELNPKLVLTATLLSILLFEVVAAAETARLLGRAAGSTEEARASNPERSRAPAEAV